MKYFYLRMLPIFLVFFCFLGLCGCPTDVPNTSENEWGTLPLTLSSCDNGINLTLNVPKKCESIKVNRKKTTDPNFGMDSVCIDVNMNISTYDINIGELIITDYFVKEAESYDYYVTYNTYTEKNDSYNITPISTELKTFKAINGYGELGFSEPPQATYNKDNFELTFTTKNFNDVPANTFDSSSASFYYKSSEQNKSWLQLSIPNKTINTINISDEINSNPDLDFLYNKTLSLVIESGVEFSLTTKAPDDLSSDSYLIYNYHNYYKELSGLPQTIEIGPNNLLDLIATPDADGINFSVELPNNVSAILLQRSTNGDLFDTTVLKITNDSNAYFTAGTYTFYDYFVESNETYNYRCKLTLGEENNSLFVNTKKISVTTTGGKGLIEPTQNIVATFDEETATLTLNPKLELKCSIPTDAIIGDVLSSYLYSKTEEIDGQQQEVQIFISFNLKEDTIDFSLELQKNYPLEFLNIINKELTWNSNSSIQVIISKTDNDTIFEWMGNILESDCTMPTPIVIKDTRETPTLTNYDDGIVDAGISITFTAPQNTNQIAIHRKTVGVENSNATFVYLYTTPLSDNQTITKKDPFVEANEEYEYYIEFTILNNDISGIANYTLTTKKATIEAGAGRGTPAFTTSPICTYNSDTKFFNFSTYPTLNIELSNYYRGSLIINYYNNNNPDISQEIDLLQAINGFPVNVNTLFSHDNLLPCTLDKDKGYSLNIYISENEILEFTLPFSGSIPENFELE